MGDSDDEPFDVEAYNARITAQNQPVSDKEARRRARAERLEVAKRTQLAAKEARRQENPEPSGPPLSERAAACVKSCADGCRKCCARVVRWCKFLRACFSGVPGFLRWLVATHPYKVSGGSVLTVIIIVSLPGRVH